VHTHQAVTAVPIYFKGDFFANRRQLRPFSNQVQMRSGTAVLVTIYDTGPFTPFPDHDSGIPRLATAKRVKNRLVDAKTVFVQCGHFRLAEF
jgi:hypothetical protein